MAIILYESFRAVFYLPFYLAHALGAYEAEDVPVTLGTSPDLESVAAQLRSGEADVYWGGPMRIMMNHDRDPDCAIVGFCEAISRDPFLLIGREPRPQFRMADLTEITLATVSEVPTPWMCLQDDLRRDGLDRLRYTKRQSEARLARWTAKLAVAKALGLDDDPAILREIVIRNAPDGAPFAASNRYRQLNWQPTPTCIKECMATWM